MLVHAIRWLLCFWFAFLADIFWVLWSNATKPKDKRWWSTVKAGLWAVALAIPAMFNTKSWLTDTTFAYAIILGMFAGTVFAVRREQRKLDG